MNVMETRIKGVLLVEPRRFGDARGWFSETFSQHRMQALGIDSGFCQDNHSYSASPGTLRGLHFQIPPHAQAKLVRCSRGRILDVAIDIRQGSPTFGEHVAVELDAESGRQLFIPVGFAHGFCTLEPHSEVQYKVSDYYAPEAERGILWSDSDLAIDWPLPPEGPALSEKDSAYPSLAETPAYFHWTAR